jgi:hypothetical protein
VIPVLVDGAFMPDRDDLPGGLQGLGRRNAVRLDHETFPSDITVLLNAVERLLAIPAYKNIEPRAGTTTTGATGQAITGNEKQSEQASKANNPGVFAGQGDVAGAQYPPLPAPSPAPPWLPRGCV